jgi:hypothetical protein
MLADALEDLALKRPESTTHAALLSIVRNT